MANLLLRGSFPNNLKESNLRVWQSQVLPTRQVRHILCNHMWITLWFTNIDQTMVLLFQALISIESLKRTYHVR